MTILQHHIILLCRAIEIAIDSIKVSLERYGGSTLVVDSCNLLAIDLTNSFGNTLTREVHTHRVALHNSSRTIDIYNQTRQEITLSVNKSVAGGLRVVGQIQRATHIEGTRHTVTPPSIVDILLLESEHTHSDRAYLVVSSGYKITLRGIDINKGTLTQLAIALHTLDGTRKYPRVTTQERLLLASAKKNLWTRHISLLLFLLDKDGKDERCVWKNLRLDNRGYRSCCI